jgi:uncharacterized protein (TIGR02453 family)
MTIGIPAEAFDFYDMLAVENTREFWAAHKGEYEQNVREPLLHLAAVLEGDFGPARLYRPHRDMRFSRDKAPIKDHQGLLFEGPNGLGWYVQVSAAGLMAAGGWYQSTPGQVKRYRESLLERGGTPLRAALKVATKGGFAVDGDQLKTRPRGVPEDAPDLDLLRYRTLHVTRTWEPEAWMGTKRVERTLRTALEKIRPLVEVLTDMVGPQD